MGVDLAPMSVEDFLAFTDTRPDEERWELIDGTPVLNATSTHLHQKILANLMWLFGSAERVEERPWVTIPGIGVRVSNTSLPVPDLIVRPREAPRGDPKSRECDDIIVAFEVLSPSTARKDLRWKREAYTRLPALSHYVIVMQDEVELRVYHRAAEFREERLLGYAACLDLAGLGVSIPLSEIYRNTGLT